MYHYKLPPADAHMSSWQDLFWTGNGAWLLKRVFKDRMPEGAHHNWGVKMDRMGEDYLIMPRWADRIRYYAVVNILQQLMVPYAAMPMTEVDKEEWYQDNCARMVEDAWQRLDIMWGETPLSTAVTDNVSYWL